METAGAEQPKIPAGVRPYEAQQRKCWQQYIGTVLHMTEILSELCPLPTVVEAQITLHVRQYHSGMLSVQDTKQVIDQAHMCSRKRGVYSVSLLLFGALLFAHKGNLIVVVFAIMGL